MNIQGFYTGREFDADTFLLRTPMRAGTHFAVWAPSARDVKVITSGLSDGSWAEWQMHRSYSGCWEADAAGVTRGTCYQYRVCGADGSVVDHCDPLRYGHDTAPRWPQHCVGRTHLPVDGFRLDGKAQQEL